VTVTAEGFLPHALPGFIAWLREQAAGDDGVLFDLHKLIIATPDYHDWGIQYDKWHVADENPDLAELRAGRLPLVPGLFELHCRECHRPYPCATVREIAARYRDRPGFEDGWTLRPPKKHAASRVPRLTKADKTLEIEGPSVTCGHCRFSSSLDGEFSVEDGRLTWRAAPDPQPGRGPGLFSCCESDPVVEFKHVVAGDREFSSEEIAALRVTAGRVREEVP
jgi:hypothetical protein